MEDLLAVILAGGGGTRLRPLTRDRAKPAVPWGASYRVIDFPLSVSVGNKIKKTLIFTQYKSMPLEKHITTNWQRFLGLSNEIEIASPEQTAHSQDWFDGTADSLLQYKHLLERYDYSRVLVLSGDHILPPKDFRLDQTLAYHEKRGGALTIIAKKTPVSDELFETIGNVRRFPFGVLQVNDDFRVTDFTEKPPVPARIPNDESNCLASMGIYIFEKDALLKFLKGNPDFGSQLIPNMLKSGRDIHVFPYESHWEDIGTIKAYYKSNMGLLLPTPTLDLHELSVSRRVEDIDPFTGRKFSREEVPLRNAGGSYPPTRINVNGSYSLVSGSQIDGEFQNSIFRNSIVDRNSQVHASMIMNSVLRACNLRRTIVDHNNNLEGVTIDPESIDYTQPHEIDKESGLIIEQDLKSGLAYLVDPASKVAVIPRKEPKGNVY